ncbi:hypothetical protein KY329_01025 [Candidatus Woesearchaeota archaeon]|nr:hypothetical protein [Candidatus Woesearchaeota archaeon]
MTGFFEKQKESEVAFRERLAKEKLERLKKTIKEKNKLLDDIRAEAKKRLKGKNPGLELIRLQAVLDKMEKDCAGIDLSIEMLEKKYQAKAHDIKIQYANFKVNLIKAKKEIEDLLAVARGS